MPKEESAPQAPYVHQPYPSVRYHRGGNTRIVSDEDEHNALMADPDWAETPAAFEQADDAGPMPAAPETGKRKK